jgi:hypothetical protein
LRGASLIQPEAKEDWARVGVGGQHPARSAISSNRGAGFLIAWGEV